MLGGRIVCECSWNRYCESLFLCGWLWFRPMTGLRNSFVVPRQCCLAKINKSIIRSVCVCDHCLAVLVWHPDKAWIKLLGTWDQLNRWSCVMIKNTKMWQPQPDFSEFSQNVIYFIWEAHQLLSFPVVTSGSKKVKPVCLEPEFYLIEKYNKIEHSTEIVCTLLVPHVTSVSKKTRWRRPKCPTQESTNQRVKSWWFVHLLLHMVPVLFTVFLLGKYLRLKAPPK